MWLNVWQVPQWNCRKLRNAVPAGHAEMDGDLLTIAANGNIVPVKVPQIRQQMQPVVAAIEAQIGRCGDPDPIGRLRTMSAA